MATSTVEDYLKCILLEERNDPGARVPMGQVGALLGVAPGTVTAMVKTLAESGLVDYEPYAGVRLSDAGERLATHVLRRHRLIELFLVEIVGLDWSEVHDEAEQLEHAVSDRLIERLDELLGRPAVDPHGDPIPDRRLNLVEPRAPSLMACRLNRPLRVVRVRDQRPDFLRQLEREGLKVGERVAVRSRTEASDSVELEVAGRSITLGARAASKILVDEVEALPGG